MVWTASFNLHIECVGVLAVKTVQCFCGSLSVIHTDKEPHISYAI